MSSSSFFVQVVNQPIADKLHREVQRCDDQLKQVASGGRKAQKLQQEREALVQGERFARRTLGQQPRRRTQSVSA
jgi:hypothetical protein